MALKVQEAAGTSVQFANEEAGRLVGYIHPSGALMILSEVRDESNLVSSYTSEYAYAPGGWVDASGDYVFGPADEILSKIL